VLFNHLRIPATGDDWPDLLDLDFVPPRIAEVEQVLESLTNREAERVQPHSRGIEPALSPERIRLFDQERRSVLPWDWTGR